MAPKGPYRLCTVNTVPDRAKRLVGRLVEDVKETYTIDHVENAQRIEDVKAMCERNHPDVLVRFLLFIFHFSCQYSSWSEKPPAFHAGSQGKICTDYFSKSSAPQCGPWRRVMRFKGSQKIQSQVSRRWPFREVFKSRRDQMPWWSSWRRSGLHSFKSSTECLIWKRTYGDRPIWYIRGEEYGRLHNLHHRREIIIELRKGKTSID